MKNPQLFKLKYSILIILIQMLVSNGISQNPVEKLTKAENLIWLKGLKSIEDKNSQIDEIKSKIIKDSIYRRPQLGDVVRYRVGEEPYDAVNTNCDCKIYFLLQVRKKSYLLDYDENEMTGAILKLFESNNISEIMILEEEHSFGMFGSRGICGSIILFSEEKQIIKEIKKASKYYGKAK